MTFRLSSAEDTAAVSLIRGLAMDAPLTAKSGHQGTAMALAPLGHVLYSRVMQHDPAQPKWRNRDRFILSNGHASILQYALLFLNGYGLELDDIKAFRQWGSQTPGHPEAGHTAGVEVTTGPLGQGFANAVGMAIAERNLRARFGESLTDHYTYVVVGDGCLMEGISHEAASLAGHLGLDRLICIFDDNGITIDGSTSLSCSDDVVSRFRAYGWNVIELGEIANDLDALETALLAAKQHQGQPIMCVLKTHIGYPSPDHTDNPEAHGNPFTAEQVRATKQVMGIPDVPFWAPDEIVDAVRTHAKTRGEQFNAAYAQAADLANQTIENRENFEHAWNPPNSSTFAAELPTFEASSSLATRQAIQKVLEASHHSMPGLITGAADLTGNTGVKVSQHHAHSAAHPEGRQIYFGIREHAMGAALVGMAMHGGVFPVSGTFFVFADYMRPSIRLAALSDAKAVFVFSHDSVGVGEDGPTHQPIEQLASLRAIPGLQVIRPADANETVQAWRVAVDHDGPTALILSRQGVPLVTDGSAVVHGAGIVMDPDHLNAVLIGTGSEVSLCLSAAEMLARDGIGVRVVSMPSWDRFERQSVAYQDSVLPVDVPTVSVEAGSTFGWSRYANQCIGIDQFGASAPGAVVLENLGINVAHICEVVRLTLKINS
ncbi:MAG: transketolase [Ilumatobacteraceae bacterium]